MRLILAIFLPWLQFYTIKKPIIGTFFLIIQILAIIIPFLIFLWPIASIWSIYSLYQYNGKKRTDKIVAAIKEQAALQGKNTDSKPTEEKSSENTSLEGAVCIK